MGNLNVLQFAVIIRIIVVLSAPSPPLFSYFDFDRPQLFI